MLQHTVPAWFEIPATDMDRAVKFYESVVAAPLRRAQMGEAELAVFPYEKPAPSGALMRMVGWTPSTTGTVVYLNLDDIKPALQRATDAGGAVLVPRTALPEGMGYFAQIRDSEGNRVGLFSLR